MVVTKTIQVPTKGQTDVIDVTAEIEEQIRLSRLKTGLVCVSVRGSTGALTTCEFEPGLVQDLKDVFNRLIPPGDYHHDKTWHDGNGHSHVRASLVGPSVTLPFVDGHLVLGTWQQIVLIDFDTRGRQRDLLVQMIGE